MRKKSGFTFVEQAIVLVPEFKMFVHKLEQQVTLRGQSRSTLQNYIRRIALFVIHFGKLPRKIDPRSPSRSSFKHMVYGLRYYYRLSGMNREAIALPSLKKDSKLPVILNRRELKEQLGHADITPTMIYLHVAQCPLIKPHSPLDSLYNFTTR
ncbi:MAG: hypothetical protein PHI03_12695 [Bacteroidales bacterium]|nr:hypothetical protein [Bacteroidales bacterium]